MDHYILDSNNGQITLTKFLGRTNAALGALGTAPLGTADGTATGEVGLKVIAVGSTLGASAGASMVSSTAAEASHVLKASAGTLISLVGYNGKATAQFIQLHNSATVPADTAVPVYSFTVPATSNFSLDIPPTGAPFSTGISVCNSSTQATKTVGTTDCWFTAVIK